MNVTLTNTAQRMLMMGESGATLKRHSAIRCCRYSFSLFCSLSPLQIMSFFSFTSSIWWALVQTPDCYIRPHPDHCWTRQMPFEVQQKKLLTVFCDNNEMSKEGNKKRKKMIPQKWLCIRWEFPVSLSLTLHLDGSPTLFPLKYSLFLKSFFFPLDRLLLFT